MSACLEFRINRYIQVRLVCRGVSLKQYLADPIRYEREAASLDHRPLLPAQRAVRDRVDRLPKVVSIVEQVARLHQRNGACIESLRHRRHPRRHNSLFLQGDA